MLASSTPVSCRVFASSLVLVVMALLLESLAFAEDRLGVQRKKYPFGPRYLEVEFLDNNIAHFELYEQRNGVNGFGEPILPGPDPDGAAGIYVTPMIDKANYNKFPGPSRAGFSMPANSNQPQTSDMTVTIDNESRCVTIHDRIRDVDLTRLCGDKLDQDDKRLVIDRHDQIKNIYGVGNLFYDTTTANGDWVGRHWHGRKDGNFRFGPNRFPNAGEDVNGGFDGGGPSSSQFPMVYAVGDSKGDGVFVNFGLLLDQIYLMSWNFGDDSPNNRWLQGDDQKKWFAETRGDQLRWFVITGKDLKEIQFNYARLVGKPPVPPKNVLGHWVSKFGYQNWDDVNGDLASLKQKGFPVEGFALDLQWFGGSFNDQGAPARMGTLRFDQNRFPNPEKEVPSYLATQGLRFMPIEESYVDNRLPDYNDIQQKGYLAQVTKFGPAVNVTTDIFTLGNFDTFVWWGKGGMLDHTFQAARKFWHQNRRMYLALMGINAHWLDLGEPEMYYNLARYYGFPELKKDRHGDIHNVYNLFWSMGVSEGYSDPDNQNALKNSLHLDEAPRFWTMSRAGTLGSHRYGGMWSGDVGRNMGNMLAHYNTKVVNMSMLLPGSFYSSDAGGFLNVDDVFHEPGYSQQELYTQWFGNNSLTDAPVRAHGWSKVWPNEAGDPVSPDKKGDVPSNLANIQRRYELTPYLYTLAHQAHQTGEPMYPPLFYAYQDDVNVRTAGHENMIGDSLLFAMVGGFGQRSRPVYLPKGRWVDYESLDWWNSNGQNTTDIRPDDGQITVYRNKGGNSVFMPPLFAKAGAIIPKMFVDQNTRTLGGFLTEDFLKSLSPIQKNIDDLKRNQLVVRVFASNEKTDLTLIEDDGVTIAYSKDRVRKTFLEQQPNGKDVIVKIHGSEGSYTGAPDKRANVIELVVDNRQAVGVDGIPACGNKTEFDVLASNCWENTTRNLIRARFNNQSVGDDKTFVVRLN